MTTTLAWSQLTPDFHCIIDVFYFSSPSNHDCGKLPSSAAVCVRSQYRRIGCVYSRWHYVCGIFGRSQLAILLGSGRLVRCRGEYVSYLKTHLPMDKMAAILTDDIFKCIFLNENDKIPIQVSLKFIARCPIDNKAVLVQVMAWRRTGDKPLPVSMLTNGRWVNSLAPGRSGNNF